jgi:high affinity sulfate transporter 1
LRFIPLARQLQSYQPRWLLNDVVAGVVLAGLLIPAGMGYAEAAGLPAITGLYATIVPLLVYALVGPSRILVFGPDSSLAPLIAGLVVPLSGGDPGKAIALASMMSIFAGVMCLVAGLARFGFLADLLSKPVRYGYLNGIAIIVLVGQIPRLLGFSGRSEALLDGLTAVRKGIQDGMVNWWSTGVGVGALVVLIVLRRLDRRIPGALCVLVGSIVVAVVFDLASHDVALLGELPKGLPSPSWPGVGVDQLGSVAAAAFGVAFISFADTSVLSRTYALKSKQTVDPNHELMALGAVNVAAGFFQGFAVSSSTSRTPVADDAGSKTQLTGVVGALVVSFIVIAAPGIFRNLPNSALAAIVIMAALRLFEVKGVVRLFHVRASEFVLSVASFLAVLVLGPIVGIGVAIALSLLNFMRKAWRPHTTELVRVDQLKGYHDRERHPRGHAVPGLLLYRFDSPLFFANAGFLTEDVLNRVDGADPPIRRVVITAEPMTDIDSTGADELTELIDRLDERHIEFAFAELKDHVRERLERYGLVERVGADRFYRTVGEAVHTYVDESGVEWEDWEEAEEQREAAEAAEAERDQRGGAGNSATPPA